MEKLSLFWFRRDLRLYDNRGLSEALAASRRVICLFIYDTDILKTLTHKSDARLSFITDQVLQIKKELERNGSTLWIRYGKPAELLDKLTGEFDFEEVYANHDYEPYARDRDDAVQQMLNRKGINFHTFKDQVVFEKSEILKDNGEPYMVFTPYMKKWLALLQEKHLHEFPSHHHLNRTAKAKPAPDPDLKKIGFEYAGVQAPPSDPDDEIIRNYDRTRDFPAINGTTRLGVHLRFGTVSIRRLFKKAQKLNDVFLSELIWREFYMMILWHFPYVTGQAFKPAYDNIRWINNEKHFKAWQEGRTGFPIVDAGMRQLNHEGYMHNRVRMITASFLTKHLLTDWRWGEAWFAGKLLDYELSSNNGGWQWAAGSGCDAAPYFRVFNPALQTKKFDPNHEYIKRWIPEINSDKYPQPIVDHKSARERALKAYKQGLSQS